jgi:hypothetical protein
MTMSVCPHCGSQTLASAAFCESCGKAVSSGSAGPRIVGNAAQATSGASAKLMADGLKKYTKRAMTTLIVLGCLQLVIAAVFYSISTGGPVANRGAMQTAALVTAGLGVVFLGLGFWARSSPLPATVVGTVLYGSLIMLNVVNWANQPGGARGLPVGLLDIIIVAFLLKGIQAALEYRKLTSGKSA